jgi:hypothetical protein
MGDYGKNVNLLFSVEGAALLDAMPLLQTAAAAGRGGVLSDEDWMVAHRRLLAVVCGLRWCKTLSDKIFGVLEDGFETFSLKVIELYFSQTKATPEVGFLQRMKQRVQVAKNFVHKQINRCS